MKPVSSLKNQLFREGVEDRMLSTQDLDQAPQNLLFRGWFVVWATLAILIITITFSYFVKIPVSVSGPGVVWNKIGIRNMMVNSTGVIDEILINVGDVIMEGDLVATINQDDIENELKSQERESESIQNYISELEKIIAKDKKFRLSSRIKIDELIEQSQDRYKIKEDRLKARRNQVDSLFSKKLIETDRYYQLLDQIDDAKDRMINTRKEKSSAAKEIFLNDIQLKKEILSQKRSLAQIKNQIKTLRNTIRSKSAIRSSMDGKVIEVDIDVGDYLSSGQSVAAIQPDKGPDSYQGMIYINPEEGSKVKVGMKVELEVSAWPKDKYGVLIGNIKQISRLPSSTESMMRSLKNDQLVEHFTGDGAPFEVVVELEIDPENKESFKWSSSSDENRDIQNGMILNGKVIVREKRLIDLISPESI